MDCELVWQQNNKILAKFELTGSAEAFAQRVRDGFSLVGKSIKPTDTLCQQGEADFGMLYALAMPPALWIGDGAPWTTRCMIDETKTQAGVITKPLSTPGFALTGGGYLFRRMNLVGQCWNKTEDGACIGWAGDENGDVIFEDCVLDGREACAWLVYSWAPNGNRKITLRAQPEQKATATTPAVPKGPGCTMYISRIGVAAPASGNGLQTVLVEDTLAILDANGARDEGATSAIDMKNPDQRFSGVLSCVVNRKGDTTCRRLRARATGLVTQYDDRPTPSIGNSRIAVLGTNRFPSDSNSDPGPTTWQFDSCESRVISPGTAFVVNDIDVRGINAKVAPIIYNDANIQAVQAAGMAIVKTAQDAVVAANAKLKADYIAARGGSSDTGLLKQWTAPVVATPAPATK